MSSNFSGFQAFPTHREASWLNNTDQPSFWTHLTIWNHPTHPSESNHLTILTQHWIWIKLAVGSSLKSGIWNLTFDHLAHHPWNWPSGSTLKRFGPLIWIWTFHLNRTTSFSVSLPSHPAFKAFASCLLSSWWVSLPSIWSILSVTCLFGDLFFVVVEQQSNVTLLSSDYLSWHLNVLSIWESSSLNVFVSNLRN